MTAVRYYAEAADAALAHFSPEECIRIIERAWPLLEQAPDGPERNALQITIGTLHGLAATRVLGAGSEAKNSLQRAYSLLDEAPQHPMRGRLLHGFGFMLCLRAEYAEALAVADRAEALGSSDERSGAPCLPRAPCMGRSISFRVARAAARTWLERGLTLCRAAGRGSWRIPGRSAGRAARFARQSRCFILARSSKRAHRCSAPMSAPAIANGRWRGLPRCGTARCSRCGSATPSAWPLLPTRCTRSSRNSRSRTAEPPVGGFAAGRTPEWASRATAIDGSGRRTKRTRGSECWPGASEILGYATEALVLAGDLDGAQKQLEEALQIADKLGERVYLPQLFVIAG